MRKWLLMLFVVVMVTPAHSEPLDNPYGGSSQQTLDEAVALSRLPGDRSFPQDHVRSFGCPLIFANEGLRPS